MSSEYSQSQGSHRKCARSRCSRSKCSDGQYSTSIVTAHRGGHPPSRQPIFMQDGSCCGVYGKHADTSEACVAKEECTACYAPHRFGREGCAPRRLSLSLALSLSLSFSLSRSLFRSLSLTLTLRLSATNLNPNQTGRTSMPRSSPSQSWSAATGPTLPRAATPTCAPTSTAACTYHS